MTGAELKTIRHKLGLSAYALGRALGLEGTRNTVQVAILRYERGDRPIPLRMARQMLMFQRFGVPADFLPAHAAE